MRRWKLEDARDHFSEVVRQALEEGPQLVTRRGREAVVILNVEEYESLTAPEGLFGFLQRSPLADALEAGELQRERAPDGGPGPRG